MYLKTLFALLFGAVFHLTVMAQGLTGALIGTIKDAEGGALLGVSVRVSSPALIGGAVTMTTSDRGQLRFPSLPPGTYVLTADLPGFAAYREDGLHIGAGSTLERNVILTLAGRAESVVVEGTGSRVEVRGTGFGTRVGSEDLRTIPVRRSSMFDAVRSAPGISPTSPSSATVTTVSAFGSGTNENQFLIDGTNFTCPCNGVARAEPGVDFIQEVQIQSTGASVEFGNVQGAVINVLTRQGGDRLAFDASYYGQAAALTSQPVVRPLTPSTQSGYERDRYRDVTTNVGGPVIRNRLWAFGGYQHLRDYDSQPGTDPSFPRKYEQDKLFAKLTWSLAPGWQLVQSIHNEFWVNPDPPTSVTPFVATLRRSATVPAVTFGHLTNATSPNTVWDIRVGRFLFSQDNAPSSGDRNAVSRVDSASGVLSGGPMQIGELNIARTTVKATISRYRGGLLGADHEWRTGAQVERGGHHAFNTIPTGVRFVDNDGRPSQSVSAAPSHVGGQFVSSSAFASDAATIGNRLTISAGLRFDRNRAISQDLSALDLDGHETDQIVEGLGTLYTWNLWSPRLGVTTKLTADGRTMVRAAYGRFYQGILTGELEPFHPGQSTVTTAAFEEATGGYTRILTAVNSRTNLRLDPDTRAPYTDEYSVSVDREIGRTLAVAAAYVRKNGRDFIGWTDIGGQYRESSRVLPDGRTLPVFELVNGNASRLFYLTNPDGYFVRYDGLVLAAEKRRADGWQAVGSYTFSKNYGLQASGGTSAAGAQVSTVSPPQPLTFGRDPNDLTNARGRTPNDRPHVVRAAGSLDVPRTGVMIAANMQYFTGKPWASSALVQVPQNNQQRVLIESRGSRRLSSQSLLDVRVLKAMTLPGAGRVEVLLDLLNALNDTAEEAIATDNAFNANAGAGTVFMDPRRVMLSVRLNLGR
jgi:hypothetical protein